MRYVLLLLLSLALFGCPGTQKSADDASAAFDTAGRYIHAASGMAFPREVGSFERGQVQVYDQRRFNISVAYNVVEARLIAATVYVYPAGRVMSAGSPPEVIARAYDRVMENHFASNKTQVHRAHPNARLVTQGPAPSPLKSGADGRRAVFEFQGTLAHEQRPLTSELLLFRHGSWWIKYRFTYPVESKATVRPAIDEFMRQLSWPADPS